MNRIKKLLCILFSALTFITMTFSASAYTVDEITDIAVGVITSLEGTYDSVNANDNGAVSLGLMGWHADRALNLLKTIVNANSSQATSILGDTLYNEIVSSSDWSSRTLNTKETSAVKKLLATTESIEAQDTLAAEDVSDYIIHGQSLGFTDAAILVFLADIENQCGSGVAERVADSAISAAGSVNSVTLYSLYSAALSDSTAGSSATRRKTVYEYCLGIGDDAVAADDSYEIGKYVTTAESGLRIRNGPGFTYDYTGVLIPYGTTVTVTQVSSNWGKVTYGGVTGWIYLEYAKYSESNISSSAVTTALSASSKSNVAGDADGNGSVTVADARLVLRCAASLESLSEDRIELCDINENGSIDVSDARSILKVAAGLKSL